MEALDELVARAQAGDRDAYAAIVRRFQDMAVGYGYSLLVGKAGHVPTPQILCPSCIVRGTPGRA